jgi:hypothetical protein
MSDQATELVDALSGALRQRQLEELESTEGTRVPPVVKKKKKKKKSAESVGTGLNESNKQANAHLVNLAKKIQLALDRGAKPGGPETEKLRKRMLAINTTRIN